MIVDDGKNSADDDMTDQEYMVVGHSDGASEIDNFNSAVDELARSGMSTMNDGDGQGTAEQEVPRMDHDPEPLANTVPQDDAASAADSATEKEQQKTPSPVPSLASSALGASSEKPKAASTLRQRARPSDEDPPAASLAKSATLPAKISFSSKATILSGAPSIFSLILC